MPLSSRLKRRRSEVSGAPQLRDGLMERGIRPSASLRLPRRPALLRIAEPLIDPGHHVPEVFPDLLDLMPLAFLAHAVEVLVAGPVLADELAGEVAGLDLAEDLLHRRP